MPRTALLVAWFAVSPSMTFAAAHVLEAGETRTLKEDLVLSGEDTLEIRGSADQRCTVVGNGHAIRSDGKWTGSVKIAHCTLQKLGAAPKFTDDGGRVAREFPALDLKLAGKGHVSIQHSSFDESSSIH